MSTRHEFLRDLLDVTNNLPEAARIEALEGCIASALNLMDRPTIQDIARELDASLVRRPEHQPIQDLIEGHLALRDIEELPEPLAGRDSSRH